MAIYVAIAQQKLTASREVFSIGACGLRDCRLWRVCMVTRNLYSPCSKDQLTVTGDPVEVDFRDDMQ